MKYLGIAALAIFASTASALCHDDYTDALYDKNKAYQAARDACNEFKGIFGAYKSKSKCALGSDGKGYDITVRHVKDGDRSLGADECYDGVQKEIHGCERGGVSGYDNWEYGIWATKVCS
ncbi:hypothetical protein GGR53DRAFT_469486 [Hypoxylon sp. FL1150]|nr:hypothetical protein GGR53DRAFT_469486 [Hypoxylon sp. FL1150]